MYTYSLYLAREILDSAPLCSTQDSSFASMAKAMKAMKAAAAPATPAKKKAMKAITVEVLTTAREVRRGLRAEMKATVGQVDTQHAR